MDVSKIANLAYIIWAVSAFLLASKQLVLIRRANNNSIFHHNITLSRLYSHFYEYSRYIIIHLFSYNRSANHYADFREKISAAFGWIFICNAASIISLFLSLHLEDFDIIQFVFIFAMLVSVFLGFYFSEEADSFISKRVTDRIFEIPLERSIKLSSGASYEFLMEKDKEYTVLPAFVRLKVAFALQSKELSLDLLEKTGMLIDDENESKDHMEYKPSIIIKSPAQ